MTDRSSISTWLAGLPHKRNHRSRSPSPSPSPSPAPQCITNSMPVLLPESPQANSQAKRKRSLASHLSPISPKRVCNPRPLTRQALKELSHNAGRSPGRPRKVPVVDVSYDPTPRFSRRLMMMPARNAQNARQADRFLNECVRVLLQVEVP